MSVADRITDNDWNSIMEFCRRGLEGDIHSLLCDCPDCGDIAAVRIWEYLEEMQEKIEARP